MKRAHVNPRPLHIIDWAHWTSEEGLEEGERTIFETTCFDSVLVNGKVRGFTRCQLSYSEKMLHS